MSDLSDSLPDSARFALWFGAWLRGNASLDAARDGIVAGDAAHDVVGLGSGPVALILALGDLKGRGAVAAGLALPVPGDPLGLAGPAELNATALERGEAVLLDGAGLAVVPMRAGAGVVWSCLPAETRRQVPDIPEADTTLRQALVEVADALARLGVARWRPEVADELMALRRPVALALPAGVSPRAQRLLATAARCTRVVALALEDDGPALSAAEADARRVALQPLDRAARRALVAACSSAADG